MNTLFHPLRVAGTFDDCQRLVKELFADAPFRKRRRVTSANSINLLLNGTTITQLREGDLLVDVVVRATGDERARISALSDINIRTSSGRYVPALFGASAG